MAKIDKAEVAPIKRRGDGARRVYEDLRNEILELKLAPGSALDETSLSKRFEMSRSPVREAIVRLAADGLVHTLSNRSTIVAPIDIGTLPRFIEAIDYLQRATTRLAAIHRTSDQVLQMREAAHIYDVLCQKGEPLALSEANKVFHMTIADAGGNPYLARAYARLLDEGRRLLHLHYSSVRSEQSAFPLSPAHHQMVDAIEAGDEAAADRLAHEHTRVLHDRMQEFIRVSYLELPM
ncbi:MAG: GntR family transcriptional regulator [Litoreibacter sp.]|uniref:GntR family transcriptional regulator n=1 Tax=Litoreibacter sp. TaxID=1969459 RepID=UPI00329923A6